MASGSERIKQLFKKYGKIALGVHLCVYGTFLTGERRRGGRQPRRCGKLCTCSCRAVSFLRVSKLTCLHFRALPRWPGCYIAIDNHVDVRTPLQKIGLLSSECCHWLLPLPGGATQVLCLDTSATTLLHAPLALPAHQLLVSPPPALLPFAEEKYDDAAAEGAEAEAQADAQNKGWMDKVLTGGSSTLALAFLCNKALFPVRTPITLGLTPVVAR